MILRVSNNFLRIIKKFWEIHLDNFWKLFHPPSTRSIVPSFALHPVLHFLHTNLSLPTTIKTALIITVLSYLFPTNLRIFL